MKNNLKLITQLTRGRARHDDVGWNLNLSRIRNSLFHIFIVHPKSDIHKIWITQAHVPTPTLTFSNAPSPRAENSSGTGSWHFFKLLHGRFQNFNLHRGNLGSPSFTTNSLYLSCTSHSSRNLQSPWAGMSNRWKGTLAKRTKLKNIS